MPKKTIIVLWLLSIYCQTALSEIVWGKFQNVNLSQCPNPDDINDKYPKLTLTNLPVTLSNGPYNKYCVKSGCNSYEPSTYTVKTPYIRALTGFRIEMEWDWNRPNYTANNTKLNSAWCVYYNQNDCYLGGAEFGYCHYNRDYLSFYAGCGYANMKNITDDLKDQIKLRWLVKPVQGKNYLNMTVIANNTGYELSVQFTSNNFQTIISYEKFEPYLSCLNTNFNRGIGKITASMDPNFNIYTRDKINYKVIEYAYDTDRLTNPLENLIG